MSVIDEGKKMRCVFCGNRVFWCLEFVSFFLARDKTKDMGCKSSTHASKLACTMQEHESAARPSFFSVLYFIYLWLVYF